MFGNKTYFLSKKIWVLSISHRIWTFPHCAKFVIYSNLVPSSIHLITRWSVQINISFWYQYSYFVSQISISRWRCPYHTCYRRTLDFFHLCHSWHILETLHMWIRREIEANGLMVAVNGHHVEVSIFWKWGKKEV